MKRLLALLCTSGLALMLAGCGGGGGGGGDTEIKNTIAAKIDSFRNAVEEYDVEEMLAFLNEEDFLLQISESGSTPYPKYHNTLKAELQEDQAKQSHWREPAPDGHGYVLTMELGVIAFDRLSANGGFATVPFTIKEEAAEIPQMVTDTGYMVCEMANLEGVWRCRRMTINFNPPKARGVRDVRAGSFGFGRLNPDGI